MPNTQPRTAAEERAAKADREGGDSDGEPAGLDGVHADQVADGEGDGDDLDGDTEDATQDGVHVGDEKRRQG
jgi:hypothetical protein